MSARPIPVTSWRLSSQLIAVFTLIDLPFAALALAGWSALLGLTLEASSGAALLLTFARLGLYARWWRRLLGPVDRWQRSADPDDALLDAADLALARAGARFTASFAAAWVGSYILTGAWIWFARAEAAPLAVADLGSALGFLLGTYIGARVFPFAVCTLALARPRAELSRALARRARSRASAPVSLMRRFGLLIFGLVAAPVCLIGATAWSNEVAFDRFELVVELDEQLERELDRLDADRPLDAGRVVSGDALPTQGASAALEQLPVLRHRVSFDRRSGSAVVAAALPDGRWLLVEGSLRGSGRSSRGFAAKLLIFCVVLGIYAVAMGLILPRSLIDPLHELERVLRRLVERGDLLALEHTPVVEDDELGRMTRCVNELADELRGLAGSARAIAEGTLTNELLGEGDLLAAFRAMQEQLRRIVAQLRETTVDVASAAAEILAATRAQEDAAEHSARAVQDVSGRLASLAQAAEDIATNASDVRQNAAQTQTMADAVVARIAELERETGGISELLELIREIAERSDLLALNGSLEATRAGEAGRGFALVAGEMRRLAERTKGVVIDVRGRIAEIDSTSAATVAATERSRELAEQTASAAQTISAGTREQSDDMGHVSESMLSMAELVSDTSSATIQTRAAAEDLRTRIAELERATQRFELPPEPEPEPRGRGY